MKKSLKRVLIVEDDADIRSLLVTFFKMNEFEVESACNGVDAIAKLKSVEKLPQLIVLDLMMPDMDGAQFRKHQLSEPLWSDIPVVIMSADSRIQEKARDMKVEHYLKKPVDIDAIMQMVEKCIPSASASESNGSSI